MKDLMSTQKRLATIHRNILIAHGLFAVILLLAVSCLGLNIFSTHIHGKTLNPGIFVTTISILAMSYVLIFGYIGRRECESIFLMEYEKMFLIMKKEDKNV